MLRRRVSQWSEVAFCRDLPSHEKNPESRKNPDCQKTVKTHNFFLYFGIFGIFHSGFFTRDFFGIFPGFSNSDPDPRDVGIFEISLSRFFRDFLRFSYPDPDSPDFEIFGIFHLGFFRDFEIFGIFRSSIFLIVFFRTKVLY